MHVPKPVIVVLFTAVGLLGIGVAAAAVGDDNNEGDTPDEPTTEPTTTVPETTLPAAAGAAQPDDAGDAPDDGDGQAVERYYGPECGEQIPGGTHGDYVSRAAQDPAADVSAMAQSNCGRPLVSVHSAPTPGAPEGDGDGEDDGEGGGNPHGDPPGQTAPGQTQDHGPPDQD